ncbi:winged helix-turn-helix domain-containing protein [Phreatobacter stygius]|uniref:LysR family transcriptional regulator n=1 Tax=Phreatobacter stygius TaxID=1940610 RepID=A0A4D7BA44_9HYPH|nr:LysR family transcriptional regulator [Phreatobacter stygius]QCI66376.1 LysR family transcriptional regulator [Phreatobacter stygius]
MRAKQGTVVSIKPKRPPAAGSGIARLSPRLRIVFGEAMRLGPGKIDLLEAIGRTGSISAAGRELGMSYRRAWVLVDAVNKMFTRAVVTAAAGGSQGGGAQLTEFGLALVTAYRRVEARTLAAIQEELAPFDRDIAQD